MGYITELQFLYQLKVIAALQQYEDCPEMPVYFGYPLVN